MLCCKSLLLLGLTAKVFALNRFVANFVKLFLLFLFFVNQQLTTSFN